MIKRVATAFALVAIPLSFAMGQALRAPTRAEQETLYNEMVKSIREAATKHAATTTKSSLNRKIRTRLFSCSLAYSLMAKRPEIAAPEKEWFLMGAELYPRVALALKDIEGSLKTEIEEGKAQFESKWGSQRELFLFLRACQDFSNPENAQTAIMDIVFE